MMIGDWYYYKAAEIMTKKNTSKKWVIIKDYDIISKWYLKAVFLYKDKYFAKQNNI